MQKPFHLWLKNLTVAEMQPVFPMIPHSSARLTAASTMVPRSQPRIFSFLKRDSMTHFGESQDKGAKEKEGRK